MASKQTLGRYSSADQEQSFHTDVDAGDILTLYTANMPQEGGAQYLASSWEVYNHLATEYPVVLETLTMDWRFELPTL